MQWKKKKRTISARCMFLHTTQNACKQTKCRNCQHRFYTFYHSDTMDDTHTHILYMSLMSLICFIWYIALLKVYIRNHTQRTYCAVCTLNFYLLAYLFVSLSVIWVFRLHVFSFFVCPKICSFTVLLQRERKQTTSYMQFINAISRHLRHSKRNASIIRASAITAMSD